MHLPDYELNQIAHHSDELNQIFMNLTHVYRLLGSKRKVSKHVVTRICFIKFYYKFTILSKSTGSVYYKFSMSFFLQLGGPDQVAEMTGRRGMLVRAQSGKGVIYQARNT